jgi:UDPglucose--hexose-1-phosphate uridylyltransferase
MGSNSDLPIVGGSILNHEHFQGGAHIMPIMKALPSYEVKIKKIPEVKLEALSWFGTAITITGKDKNKILDAMDLINSKWRIYNNPALDIISKTNLQHSTTTTIVRKIKDQYVAYVLLRNNRADERYPSGIFHAHQEHHGIKSEGIGLIEAGGLFILPARLKRQFQLIEDGFAKGLSGSELLLQNKELSILSTLIKSITPNGKSIKEQITLFVNDTCKQILINTAVFKPTKEGRAAFKDFLLSLNE